MTIQPDQLTRPRKEESHAKRHANPAWGLRLFPGKFLIAGTRNGRRVQDSGWPRIWKSETLVSTSLQRPVSTATKCRTTAGGEVDYVFITLMLDAHTWSKLMDSVYQMLNLKYEDADHIISTILLQLFTFTPMRIRKKHDMFVYLHIYIYIYINTCIYLLV